MKINYKKVYEHVKIYMIAMRLLVSSLLINMPVFLLRFIKLLQQIKRN